MVVEVERDDLVDGAVDQAPARAGTCPLLDLEVIAGLWGHLLSRRIDDAMARECLTVYDDLAIRKWPVDAALRDRILSLAHTVTARDAAYVTLAEAFDAR